MTPTGEQYSASFALLYRGAGPVGSFPTALVVM